MDHHLKANEIDAYYAEALSWDQSRVRSAENSRRLAWIIAGTACVLTCAAVFAMAALAPLKKTEAYVITVDKSTGATEVATALTGTKPVSYDEAVSKFFLSQYVHLREGWLPSAGAENFANAALLSTADEQKRWSTAFDFHNPNSPQVTYGTNAMVDIKIRSVSFINSNVAQVRFTKLVQSADAQPKASNWVAILSFGFTAAPESEADRLKNPLGFQVSSYRSDPEA